MMIATLPDTSLTPLLGWAAEVFARCLHATGPHTSPAGGVEALRGLVLAPESVRAALAAPRPARGLVDGPPPLPAPLAAPLGRLGADAFDLAVIGLSLATELSAPVARAVAYLHDDARRRRLSVDLLATMCGELAGDWSDALQRLSPDARLCRRGLLNVSGIGCDAEVRPSAAVIRHASGVEVPAPELAHAVARAVALPESDHPTILDRWGLAPERFTLHVHGAAADTLGARAACAIAGAGRRAMLVDLAALDASQAPAVAGHCLLGGLVALLVVPPDGHAALPALLDALEEVCLVDPAHALWQAPPAPTLRPVASIELAPLSVREREAAVAAGLANHGLTLETPDAALPFARRYRHAPDGIRRVLAATAAHVESELRVTARADDLLAIAATLAGGPLRDLATRVERTVGWADLAVPDPVAEQLRELCARVDVRDVVLDDRGYGETIGTARGVSAVFAGPSGTGKTLAASVVACELGLALYRVDLARIVSKYIGETERNLDAVFAAAESTDVVLLFDEADALFGRRSEVNDAHDRYANLEVAYLLQRIETYDGAAILSTNLLRNLDEAFTRRLDFRVLFPLPDERERRRIWGLVWPAGERLADDVDLDALAAEHDLSGGMIRNAVFAAAHLAASEQAPVARRHLEHALRREHDKLGRVPRLLTSTEDGR